MIAGIKTENGSCDPDHAASRVFVVQKLGLNIVYLWAKFDDSSFSRCKDIIRGPKI